MLQGSKQSAALSAAPLPTATTGASLMPACNELVFVPWSQSGTTGPAEEERADGAEPAGLGQAERGPKTKTGAHTRSFLVHPPKQVRNDQPPARLRYSEAHDESFSAVGASR